jgi:hypothetical protein
MKEWKKILVLQLIVWAKGSLIFYVYNLTQTIIVNGCKYDCVNHKRMKNIVEQQNCKT